ncbi:MAG: hypothetical protein LKF75_00880 [Bacilli bacterium]|jgi:hypothetical protein|nr:hypothetical protein [Bacilli bacterium]MCH4228249.1 hypothetical protein [Bacilli bacterium]MCH4277683.1 hypothetical protein [Bacilli bacterium]
MSLYEELEANQEKTPFSTSGEAYFFAEHVYLLSSFELWKPYMHPTDSFMTVRSNIILRSLLNKMAIEKAYFAKAKSLKEGHKEDTLPLDEYMESAMSGLPYLLFDGKKVYVPLFPEVFNNIYAGDFEKLSLPPFNRLINEYQAASIDPFDYYGNAIYDSYFTRLVPIMRKEKSLACYDYDAESLYFINDQGRLDAKICFFDKELVKPTKTHMVPRIEAVAEAYYENDRRKMLNALLSGNLISSSLIHKIAGKEIKFEEKKEKKLTTEE